MKISGAKTHIRSLSHSKQASDASFTPCSDSKPFALAHFGWRFQLDFEAFGVEKPRVK